MYEIILYCSSTISYLKVFMNNKIKSESRRYNHIISEIDGIYHEISLKQGFTDSAMMILYTLADHDGSCLLSELVKLSGVSKQTINSALRKLEENGIVFLQPAGGKSKRVTLTEKGKQTASDTVEKTIAIENRIYES